MHQFPRSTHRSRTGWLVVLAALFTLAAAGCSRPSTDASKKLVLTGSSTIAPLASELARQFEADNPGVRVDVQMGGSSRGVADARKGLNDIGMVSRRLHDHEKDLTPYTIARDGIAIILHKSNPLKGLNAEQVRSIFRGEKKSWAEFGGADAPITVVNKAEGRSTLELFLAYFKLKNSQIKASVVIGDNEQGIQTVAGNPNAIGYVSVGTAELHANAGTAIKLINLDGQPASMQTVGNGQFPLSRQLNLVTKGEPNPLAKRFIAFARSAKAHELVRRQHFVPVAR